jgi:photosystem II stability/assembly factor-like uncharacterized protein
MGLLFLLVAVYPAASHAQTDLRSIISRLKFRAIGPAATGGRISALAGDPTDPRVFYVGGASSGVWKTTDNGTTFQPIFESGEISSIGALAVAPSNPQVVWLGTGEANERASVESDVPRIAWGNGVYVSQDGGKTWRHAGLEDTHHIGKILVDPRDSGFAFVAAVGHLWGENADRGVFLTSDGGKSWKKSLYLNAHTGAVDLALSPAHPEVVYAAAYDTASVASRNDAKTDSAIYRTTDGGKNWIKLTNGLPATGIGRIALATTPANSDVVYAEIEGPNGGVYRSDDRGASWRRTNSTVKASDYISQIAVDPRSVDRVWTVGLDPIFYSEDGGETFCSSEDGKGSSYCSNWMERIHFDSHALWIDPKDSDRMLLGGDGGLYLSYNRGKTWQFLNTLPFAQYYGIGYDMQQPYWIYGGMQDTGTWAGPVRTSYTAGISSDDWRALLVGDGYATLANPSNPNIVYAEYQLGRVFRIHRDTLERRDILPLAIPGGPPYRFSHTTIPLALSHFDARTIFLAGDRLFTSHDRGDTWTATNPLVGDKQVGVLSALAQSPILPGVLWVGSDRGVVQVSRDDGKAWEDVSMNLPDAVRNSVVSRITPSNLGPGAAYVCFDNHARDDYTPFIFLTRDFGKSWTSISKTMPAEHVVRALVEDSRNSNLLFAGTEMGLYFSIDRGQQWMRMEGDLPPIRVHDLFIHPREHDLVIGSHGRGIFVLDDIRPLEELDTKVLDEEVHLFQPRTAIMFRRFNNRNNLGLGHEVFSGPNPAYGAILSYYLKHIVERPPKLTILDSSGNMVRQLTGPQEAGISRLNWDLRETTPFKVPPGLRDDPPGQPGGPRMRALLLSQGPLVLPGKYTVKIEMGTITQSASFSVEEDPNIRLSRQELRAHRAAWREVAKDWATGNAVLIEVRNLRKCLKEASSGGLEGQPQTEKTLAKWEDMLIVPYRLGNSYEGFVDPGTSFAGGIVNRLGQMYLTISNYTGSPTSGQRRVIAGLHSQLNNIAQALPRVRERVQETSGCAARPTQESTASR